MMRLTCTECANGSLAYESRRTGGWIIGLLIALAVLGLPTQSAEASVMISEFLTEGNTTLADEDGDYPDWIELFNEGTEAVNLEGWHLSDDPDNLTQWTFPAVTIRSGGYLLVMASGKDKTHSGILHTNFRLESGGEYLALTQPDGVTIAHEYAPYPNQITPKESYSYGLRTEAKTFVSTGSAVRVQVPREDGLGDSWTEASFDDSSWESATLGVGFGSMPGKFLSTFIAANIAVNNLADADRVIANPSLQLEVVHEQTDTINYLDNQDDGHFPNNSPFPGQRENDNNDNFVLISTGSIIIPVAGIWTFGINSDDGARLRIDGIDVIVDDTTHGAQDIFASIQLTAGKHDFELVYFEQGGGAEVEFFAARGQYSSFVSNRFRLVGDTEGGGLGMEGFSSLVQHDLQDVMFAQNPSVLLRVPFRVDDSTIPYNLALKMKYNDGFIAYLNGQEIGRRNAPNQAQWNSAATAKRSLTDSLAVEELMLNRSSHFLQDGLNVLAIQGFNSSLEDEDFLIDPELIGRVVYRDDSRYLTPPTPGSQNGSGVIGFVEEVQISRKHGFYEEPFEVALSTQDEGVTIRYTTDGTEPTDNNGFVYSGPIRIEKTTPLRAAAFKAECEPSASKTQTYLFVDDIVKQTRPAGYPTTWGGGVSADYDMDPDIVNDARYRDTIRDDLKTLAVVSFVTDPANLFDSKTGIYTHPESKGVAWERPTSTELFYPEGTKEGFQINNGIRIQGGYGRTPDKKKHSFRLLFKREYGPPTLRYKVFENSSVEKFDQLVLRSGYNYTWHGGEGGFNSNIARADYLRDEYARRCELATGKVASHGRLVHVYLNGLYWGIYNLCERPDDGFAAEYFGGEKEEYDVITSGTKGINTTQVKAGNKDAWNAMMALARAGKFEIPQNYEAIQQYVDIDALIDYMLVIYFVGSRDSPTVIGGGGTPWNFYSNHRRVPGEGFRFFCWDSEWTLEEPTRNVVTFHTQGYDDPSFVFLKLKSNPDFRMRVADRIQKHFFNDGGLTVESATAMYADLAEQLDRAIVGESARWGDVQSNRPKTRDDNWLPEINRLLTTYFPVRTGIVVDQLRASGFYPQVPAPAFSQQGGIVEYDHVLSIQPQVEIHQGWITTPLLKIDATWNYEQSGGNLGSTWMRTGYNDTGWSSGKALFFVENSALAAAKNTALTLGPTTFYFRSYFDLSSEWDFSQAKIDLSLFVDDGAIVYINGIEVYRIGMPEGIVNYSTFSNRTVGNAELEGPFTLPADSLKIGKNVVAVEVHQVNASSSDVVFGLALDALTPLPEGTPDQVPIYYTMDGSDPRLSDGSISARALAYQDAVVLDDNRTIKARTYLNGEWSALNEASFILSSAPTSVATLQENLRISELMFNPPDGEEYEFVELHNTHPTSALTVNGVGFTNGIELVIPNGTTIPANGYILAVPALGLAGQTAFRAYYGLGNSVTLVGPYSGKLSNSGERLTLSLLQTSKAILSFEFKDGRGWPIAADGAGHSLVPLSSAMTEQPNGSLEYGGNWRWSYAIGGSPGTADPEPDASVVINELIANSKSGESDWIELYNTSGSILHLGDWYLSDNDGKLNKWPIPAVEISAGEWISFDSSHFSDSGFGLSKDGDELYLSYLPGKVGVDRVVDAVTFKAQDADRAWGRYRDGNPYFVDTDTETRDQANRSASSTIVIDEIMYHPSSDSTGSDSTITDEYIELFNASDKVREFQNSEGVFRLDGGITFEFPANLELPVGGRLLVTGFDPSNAAALAAFKTKYALDGLDITILGPYTGKLSNRGERVALEKPKGIDSTSLDIIWGIVDEVIYFNRAPWTDGASGSGKSLQRDDPHRPGNDPSNWRALDPTPGQQQTSVRSWMLY